MKKIFKTMLCAMLLFMNIIAFCNIPVLADSAVIVLSSKNITIGENVTVKLKYSANSTITSVSGTLNFDDKVLQYVSGATSADGSNVTINDTTSGDSTRIYDIVFTAIAEGSSHLKFTMNNNDSAKPSSAASSASVTVKSDDSAKLGLSEIKLSSGNLSPTFSPATKKYSAIVPYENSKISISASPINLQTNIVGTGTQNLNVGDNKVVINALTGNVNISYEVTIKRLSQEETQNLNQISNDPLLITIGGKSYNIINDLTSITIPASFSITTNDYNGNQVNVIEDEKSKYTLYYLSAEDGSCDWYYKNKDEFKKLDYIISNEKFYIIEELPSLTKSAVSWRLDKLEINNTKISAYKSTNSAYKGLYVLYCYVNNKEGFYRYDTFDGSMQRSPDFYIVSNNDSTTKIGLNIFKEFVYLANTAKILISLFIGEIISILLLIAVLLREYFLKKKMLERAKKRANVE